MRLFLNYWIRALMQNNLIHRRMVAQLIANERLPIQSLKRLQEPLLRRSLTAAKRRLPAYRHLNVPEQNVIRFLQDIPIISKHELLSDRKGHFPRLGPARLWTARGLTSGTTGTPLDMYRSLGSIAWERAFVQRHWSWSGFKWGLKRATLRGDRVVDASQDCEPFWYYNRSENQLLLSSRHLRVPYIRSIIEQLREFAPYILQAYPSTAYDVAVHLEQTGDQLHIPFVYTSSEVLFPHQKALIGAMLNARVMDLYGMAERVAFIAQCEFGNYHVNSDYSYVEIVDESDNSTNDIGNLVGTTFHNLTMPLIRYRLSDRTSWKEGKCMCGRTYPMVNTIEGKYEDIVYGSRGSPISPSLITFAFKGLRNIQKSQIAQVGDGQWEIRVVPFQGYGEAERIALVKNIHELVDPDLAVTVVEMQDIPRTDAGKYRWVVNESNASKQTL